MQRRELLWSGAAAGIAMVSGRAFAQTSGEKLIAWTDQPPPIPPPAHDVIHNLTGWEVTRCLDHAKRQVLQHRPL